MWNKIYIVVWAIAAIVMVFLTCYAQSWLQSIGAPVVALEHFLYHSALSWTFLWFSSVVLLILANIVLWKTRRSWAMWLTLGYFAVFLAVRGFFLDPAALAFVSANGLPPLAAAIGPFFTFMLFVIGLAVVFFDQFLVVRMSEKMYPPPVSTVDEPILDRPGDDL